jgi:phosphoribosyl-AMP cyclohydrolase
MIELDFDKQGGLVPAIVQDAVDGQVLMVAYMNPASWQKTLDTGEAHYWSRTRQEIWHKGGTSGHVQKVRAVYIDCDQDTVLLKVEQIGGAACHTGHRSCFYRRVEGDALVTEGEPVFDPEKVYGK